jgi:16S rRNA (adenine1518-N6/adenine1519-N6)-dimethyltransferase
VPSRERAVRAEVERLGVRPSKARGQSFLRDPRVAERQVMAAFVGPGDRVLEVGGGLGVLTRELSRRGARVRVIEIEPTLAQELRRMRLPGVTVEEADALRVDLGRPEKVVANIPYAIASDLIDKLTLTAAAVIVIMVQKELAERLTARPGGKQWSALGAIVGHRYTVDVVEGVPPKAFWPQPTVASAVVRMRRKTAAPALDEGDYRALVRALFAARRRKIRNSVVHAAAHFHASPEQAVRAAEALEVADRRPEELATEEFEALTARLLARQ